MSTLRSTTRRPIDSALAALTELAIDLTTTLHADERHERLVDAIHRIIPADAVALLSVDGDGLVPVAARGLRAETMARRFRLADQPRLAQILRASGPVRFHDAAARDPFDGLLAVDHDGDRAVHACMGCRLAIDGEVIGVLTFDDLRPQAFDGVGDPALATVAALAAAGLRTSQLVAALEVAAVRSARAPAELVTQARARGRDELVGSSAAMRTLTAELALAAAVDLAVLVTGETGVGKEVVARALHRASPRRDQPLVYVNCAALPEALVESELFGHARGAFTGATESRAGKFEVADRGTLFLDEIGELPLAAQAKILRAVQAGELQRVGDDLPRHVDVRVVAATNRDLPAEVEAGRFRRDLYHRLSVLCLEVPPLRARGNDVVILAGRFLDEARAKFGLASATLAAATRAALGGYAWPGNVRELEHTILRAVVRAAGAGRAQAITIEPEHLRLPDRVVATAVTDDDLAGLSLADAVDEFKRRRITRAVEAAGGSWAEAARALGVNRGNLHRTASRLGLRVR